MTVSALSADPAYPALKGWMDRNGKKPRDAVAALKVSYQTVRRILLPFGDKDRRVPDEDLLPRIIDWTGGEVGAEGFYPTALLGVSRCAALADAVPEDVQ